MKIYSVNLFRIHNMLKLQAVCAVTFGSNPVLVRWQMISAEREPILVKSSATTLFIFKTNQIISIIAYFAITFDILASQNFSSRVF